MSKDAKSDLAWTNGSYVRTETDFDEEEIENENLKFHWFAVKSSQGETKEERDERQRAIKYQIDHGIIQRNGMPVGMEAPKPTLSKEQKEQLKQMQKKQELKQKRKIRKLQKSRQRRRF